MREKLTDAFLKGKKQRPPNRRESYTDTEVPGMVLRVTPSGTLTFAVQYRVGKDLIRKTIGTWPDEYKLKEARKEARRLLADRPGRKGSGITIRQLYPLYLKHARAVGERSLSQKEISFRVHILPLIGDVPIKELDRPTLKEMIETIKEKRQDESGHTIGGVGAAWTAKKFISAFCNWAVDDGYIKASPTHGWRATDIAPSEHVGRVATDDHLKYYWLAAENAARMGRPYGHICRLIMLTGCRRDEITDLRWDEVNLEKAAIEFSARRYKSGVPFIVPLVETAVAILEEQPEHDGPYVFSGSGHEGKKPYTGWSKGGPALAREANRLYQRHEETEEALSYIRPNHDWRTTIATRLMELGYDAELADRVLGHKVRTSGASARYNKIVKLGRVGARPRVPRCDDTCEASHAPIGAMNNGSRLPRHGSKRAMYAARDPL